MSDTKKRILEVALDLFSQNGFSAVSIRDICKQVGIKESSVYHHFKNKRAIFDELVHQFQEKATGMTMQLDMTLESNEYLDVEDNNFYGTVCNYFFEEYLMDDFCNKFMRLLLIE